MDTVKYANDGIINRRTYGIAAGKKASFGGKENNLIYAMTESLLRPHPCTVAMSSVVLFLKARQTVPANCIGLKTLQG